MKTLLLLRHAKSSWDSPAARDFDRPLASRGERDAPRMGKALRASGVELDLVVCSTATRARQTAELALAAAKYDGELRHDDAIYEASLRDLFGVLHGLPDSAETVALVGHNPGFEDLLATLCGTESSPAHVRVPTATLACIELDVDSWSDTIGGSGSLLWMLVPKILG